MFVSYARTLLAGAVLAGLWGLGAGLQAGQPAGLTQAPSPPGGLSGALRHFSADLTIRHRRLTPGGAPIGLPRPDAVMRVVREHRGGQWVTTLSADRVPEPLIAAPGGPIRLSNPFHIARVEFRDDEEQPRLLDRSGKAVRPLSADDLRLVGAAAAMRGTSPALRSSSAAGGGWLAEAGRQDERRLELVRRFGAPVGRVRGLDRYTTNGPDGRHEVLATADTVLPVEVFTSSTAAGQLRTGISYELHGSYGHVRRMIRSEHHFAEAGAGRMVTEVELTNVVLSGEVPR